MSPPNTLPRPSAPMAGRGRKRPGRCCLRRSSSCCASCTAGSRSATGPNTLKRCCRSLTAGLGYLSRARPPEFCTTPALAPPVGGRTPHRDRPGEGLGPVWQARPLVDCLPEAVQEFPLEIHKSLSLNDLRISSLIKVGSLLARTYGKKRRILGQPPRIFCTVGRLIPFCKAVVANVCRSTCGLTSLR